MAMRAEDKHVTKVSAAGSMGVSVFHFQYVSIHQFFSMSTITINHFYQGIRFLGEVTLWLSVLKGGKWLSQAGKKNK